MNPFRQCAFPTYTHTNTSLPTTHTHPYTYMCIHTCTHVYTYFLCGSDSVLMEFAGVHWVISHASQNQKVP